MTLPTPRAKSMPRIGLILTIVRSPAGTSVPANTRRRIASARRSSRASAQGHSHRSPCPPRCGRRSDTSWLQSGTVCPSSRDQYQHAAKLGAKPAQTNRSGPRTTPHGEQASRDVTRSRCLTSWPQVNGLRALRVSSIASNTTFTPSRTGPRGSISRFCC